ncbi:DUF6363 domain-containing protein, partial [Alteromonas sp. 14N.309.X.WAT.G.H12]|uniref:DUF6363 domain-containing protein n=1 Tax=Alteromonas sp. 14N.309.X.WAT.G.H12 TaxID=3120824 RepID=UPI002FD39D77
YKRGATKIVVIRTVDKGFQAQSPWLQKISAVMCSTGHCPKTIDYLLQHEQAYQKELAFIENPPEGVEIIQVFASEKLQSKLLGSSDEQLRNDYKLGRQAGQAFLANEALAELHRPCEPQRHVTVESEKPEERFSLPMYGKGGALTIDENSRLSA